MRFKRCNNEMPFALRQGVVFATFPLPCYFRSQDPTAPMHQIIEFFKDLYESGHVQLLVQKGGVPLIALIVFAETGLLVGFFLPGDTLLFLAGVGAATGFMNIWELTGALIAAAIVGDQLGYFFGYKTGAAIFTRNEGVFFKRKYAVQAHEFYQKYGTGAIVLAKFVPVMRTFVPFMAGVGQMSYRRYLLVDSLSVFLWIFLVVWSGYLLGERAKEYLHFIIAGIAVVSMAPVAIGITKAYLSSRQSKD